MKSELINKNIAIIGLGQIGYSIALGLKNKVNLIFGTDISKHTVRHAIKTKTIDKEITIEQSIALANIIVVCTPVDIAIPIVKQLLNLSTENNVIIDVGSTKQSICAALANHRNRCQFVASHPMAGTTISGYHGAKSNMFIGKRALICEHKLTAYAALNTAIEIYNILGASIEFIEPANHDLVVGLVSHLPQITAYSMCNTLNRVAKNIPEWKVVASSGFDSTSRLAKSPTSLWLPIIIHNRDNIVNNIAELINQLQTIQLYINNCDANKITTFFENAIKIREQFDNIQNTIKI